MLHKVIQQASAYIVKKKNGRDLWKGSIQEWRKWKKFKKEEGMGYRDVSWEEFAVGGADGDGFKSPMSMALANLNAEEVELLLNMVYIMLDLAHYYVDNYNDYNFSEIRELGEYLEKYKMVDLLLNFLPVLPISSISLSVTLDKQPRMDKVCMFVSSICWFMISFFFSL